MTTDNEAVETTEADAYGQMRAFILESAAIVAMPEAERIDRQTIIDNGREAEYFVVGRTSAWRRGSIARLDIFDCSPYWVIEINGRTAYAYDSEEAAHEDFNAIIEGDGAVFLRHTR